MRLRSCCIVAACIAPWALLGACGSRTGLLVLEGPPDAASDTAPPDTATPDLGMPDTTIDADDDAGLDADALPDVPTIDGAPEDAAPLCPDGGVSEAYLWSQGGTLYSFDPPTLTAVPLGMVECPTTASPWTLSVSRDGFGYMIYEDWNIYRVDLATLACETTPYQPFQLGFTGQEAIAISRGSSAERLFVYGNPAAGPTLAVTDLTNFVLTPVGIVNPNPNAFPLDMQGDAFGRLFGLSSSGQLLQIDSATAALMGEDQTLFTAQGSWAVMTYNEQIYFFAGGTIYLFDLASQALQMVGQVNDTIVGASAAACIH